jgi:hypothetical protein
MSLNCPHRKREVQEKNAKILRWRFKEVDYLQVANSFNMWLVSSPVVLMVVFQAVVFIKKAYTTGLRMGITPEQIKRGMRSGLITSIASSIAIVITMLSLMILMGAPYAWMRLSIIGSVPYELMAASTGARVMGVELGGEGYDLLALSISMWTATICAGGWLILCSLFIPKFEVVRKKIVRGNEEFLPVLTACTFLGALSYFGLPYLVGGGPGAAAAAGGSISIVVLGLLSRKLPWLKEWVLGIAMILGMLASIPFI